MSIIVTEEEVKYTFNEKIGNLPQEIVLHKFNERFLLIAPDIPSWIVCNEMTFELFNKLYHGYTIEGAFNFIIKTFNVDINCAQEALNTLLKQLVNYNFFEEYHQPKETQKPSITLHLTTQCNLSCLHCYIDAGKPMEQELDQQSWFKVIDEITEWHASSQIIFSGGEPLLYSYTEEVMAYAKEKGHTTKLLTNGTQFKSLEHMQKVLQYVDIIKISLDGVTPEIHDKIRGQGSFMKVLQTFEYLKQLHKKFIVQICVMPQNIEDLASSLRKFYLELDTSLVEFIVSPIYSQGRATKLETTILQELQETIDRSLDDVDHVPLNLLMPGNTKYGNCGFGYTGVIKPNGDVFACRGFYHSYGNVQKESFKAIMQKMSSLYDTTDVDHVEQCRDCDIRYICRGGCHVNNFLASDSYIKMCNENFKNQFYQSMVKSYDRLEKLADN